MQYYPFSVAVGASHHVLARGNFLRYYEALTGTANPTLEIKPMGSGGAGSSEFLLRPGQSIKLPVSAPGFMIENFDGIATITGRLLVGDGDFNDSVISGNVTISGTATVAPERPSTTSQNGALTVGTAAVVVQGVMATRKKIMLFAPESNTGKIFIGDASIAASNASVILSPGEMWIEELSANVAMWARSDVAAQTLQRQVMQ